MKTLIIKKMNIIKNIFAIIFLTITVASCYFFETRAPEEPDGEGTGQFIPPTIPDIVIENLIDAITNKNIENYSQCFISDVYKFVPSSDALARFPQLFDNWKLEDEKRYLLSLSTALGQANLIRITFDNKNFETISPDSAVLVTEYTLEFDLQNSGHPSAYTGKSYFTLIPTNSGLWAISKWQDFYTEQSDTSKETISCLKAYYHN